MKKKIGIYLEAAPACGGTCQYNQLLLDVLSELPKEAYEIAVIYGVPHWGERLRNQSIPSHYITVDRFWKKLPGLWRRIKLPLRLWHWLARKYHPLAKAMLAARCDLWVFPSQDAYAYLMPVNTLGTIHDLMHRYERRFPELGAKSIFASREYHYKNMCQWAKGILVDSELGKAQAVESYRISPERCHVLPFIAMKEMEKKALPAKYRLPPKFLFYPAQFWKHKNHENLLRAIALCRKELPDIQLVLVGSPKNNYENVIQLIDNLQLKQAVHLLGLVEQEAMSGLFSAARALVMPTFFGPTNIPPLEAFALACPVITSDIYAVREQLGEAALYFNPESVEEIALQIKRIWQDDALCQTLIERGKRKHAAWGFQQFSERFQVILKELEGSGIFCN